MTRKFAVLLLLIIGLPSFADEGTISLAGEWRFALDPEGTMTVTSPLNDVVTLPGTTDTNRKGTPAPLTSAPLSVSPRGDDVTSHVAILIKAGLGTSVRSLSQKIGENGRYSSFWSVPNQHGCMWTGSSWIRAITFRHPTAFCCPN